MLNKTHTYGGGLLMWSRHCWCLYFALLSNADVIPGRFPKAVFEFSWEVLQWALGPSLLRHFLSKQVSFLTRAGLQFSCYHLLWPLKVSAAIQGQQEFERIKPVRRCGLLCTARGLLSVLSRAAQAGSQAGHWLVPTLVPGEGDCDFHHNPNWGLNQNFCSDFLCKT